MAAHSFSNTVTDERRFIMLEHYKEQQVAFFGSHGAAAAVPIKVEEQAPSREHHGLSSAVTPNTLRKDVEAAVPFQVARAAVKRSYDDTLVRAAEPGTAAATASQDHVLAERKRREKISQRFVALSKIVPGLTKMDKASVLGDAIKYVKQLQEQVKRLETAARRRTVDVATLGKKLHLSMDSGRSPSDVILEGSEASSRMVMPEIEAWASERTVMIKIHCEDHKGALITALSEVESLGLTIIATNVLPFVTFLDITITAMAGDDFCLSVEEIVKKLVQAFKVNFIKCSDSDHV
ncbi:hypothetical protein ACP70R_047524 [Stipagrostis hirtigluma subsp. patula]